MSIYLNEETLARFFGNEDHRQKFRSDVVSCFKYGTTLSSVQESMRHLGWKNLGDFPFLLELADFGLKEVVNGRRKSRVVVNRS